MFEEARRLYTEEINAAVRGAKAAGATEIVVMDCHGAGKEWSFNSLVPELLEPDCEFVVQETWTEYTGFLEEGCDAALLVGMHARAGQRAGVMNHTVSGKDYFNLRFNGTLVGETGIHAALCGTWGCPVLLVTGDDVACAEGRELLGDGLTTVAVKTGLGAADSARAGEADDRGGREGGAREPDGCRAVGSRQPLRDHGRVQAHARGRPAPLPSRRRARRRPHDLRHRGDVVGGVEDLLLLTTARSSPRARTDLPTARRRRGAASRPRRSAGPRSRSRGGRCPAGNGTRPPARSRRSRARCRPRRARATPGPPARAMPRPSPRGTGGSASGRRGQRGACRRTPPPPPRRAPSPRASRLAAA